MNSVDQPVKPEAQPIPQSHDNRSVDCQGAQTLDDLIASFQVARDNLSNAIERDELDDVKKHDRQIVALFDVLSGVIPNNRQEARRLTSLLLDQLHHSGEKTVLSSRIKRDILNIAGYGFDKSRLGSQSGRLE